MKANIKDIKAIHGLLQDYGKKGELLPRPLSELYDHLRDFSVYVDNNEGEERVLGCCALQFCWEDLAEIRSLAVHPEYLRKKIGSKLAEAALAEAKSFNTKKVFRILWSSCHCRRQKNRCYCSSPVSEKKSHVLAPCM